MARARVVTLLLTGWVTVVATGVIFRLFFMPNPPVLAPATVTALGLVLALPPAVYELFRWARRPHE